jgi:hypothetical protein
LLMVVAMPPVFTVIPAKPFGASTKARFEI